MSYPRPTPPASLRDTASLLTIQIKMWSGKTTKMKLAQEGAAAISRETGEYIDTKMVQGSTIFLIDREPVEVIAKYNAATRALWRDLTCPWMDGGTRICLTSALLDLKAALNARRDEYLTRMVPYFVQAYPDWLTNARYALGPLYDPNDYPSDIARCFDFRIAITRIPDTQDFRLSGISQDDLNDWLTNTEDAMTQAFEDAQQDAWARLREPVQEMIDKLRAYDPTFVGADGRKMKGFHQSLVDNIAKVANIIPHINLYEDDTLTAFAELARQTLTTNSAEDLKEDTTLREETIDAAEMLISQMSQFV